MRWFTDIRIMDGITISVTNVLDPPHGGPGQKSSAEEIVIEEDQEKVKVKVFAEISVQEHWGVINPSLQRKFLDIPETILVHCELGDVSSVPRGERAGKEVVGSRYPKT